VKKTTRGTPPGLGTRASPENAEAGFLGPTTMLSLGLAAAPWSLSLALHGLLCHCEAFAGLFEPSFFFNFCLLNEENELVHHQLMGQWIVASHLA